MIHNEFHGWAVQPEINCPKSTKTENCWYPSTTYAKSDDQGKTWAIEKNNEGTGVLVNGSPYPYEPNGGEDGGLQGFPKNTNLWTNNNCTYFFAQSSVGHKQKPGMCLLQTNNIADPTAWRAWHSGDTFNITTLDPYLNTTANPLDHVCKNTPSLEAYHARPESVVWNSYVGSYMAVAVDQNFKTPSGGTKETITLILSNEESFFDWNAPISIIDINWLDKHRADSSVVAHAYPSIFPDNSTCNQGERDLTVVDGPCFWVTTTRLNAREKNTPVNRDITAFQVCLDHNNTSPRLFSSSRKLTPTNKSRAMTP